MVQASCSETLGIVSNTSDNILDNYPCHLTKLYLSLGGIRIITE